MKILKKVFSPVAVAIIPVLGLAMLAGCGKKGPPRPPLPPEKEAAIDLEKAWHSGGEITEGSYIKANQGMGQFTKEGRI